MTWNDPGNNSDNDRNGGRKDKDPWGSQDQGPPDLDEALGKMREQLSGIFGGRGGSGSGRGSSSGGPEISKGLVAIVLAGLLLVWGCLLYTSPSPRDDR